MSAFVKGQVVYASYCGEIHVGIVCDDGKMDGGEYWYKVRFVDGNYKFPEEDLSAIDPDHSVVIADFSGYQLQSGGYFNGIYKHIQGEDLKRHMRSSKSPITELFDAKFFVQTDVSISLAEFLSRRK